MTEAEKALYPFAVGYNSRSLKLKIPVTGLEKQGISLKKTKKQKNTCKADFLTAGLSSELLFLIRLSICVLSGDDTCKFLNKSARPEAFLNNSPSKVSAFDLTAAILSFARETKMERSWVANWDMSCFSSSSTAAKCLISLEASSVLNNRKFDFEFFESWSTNCKKSFDRFESKHSNKLTIEEQALDLYSALSGTLRLRFLSSNCPMSCKSSSSLRSKLLEE